MVLAWRDVAEPYLKAGKVVEVPGIEKEAELMFIYPEERVDDPVLQALLDELALVWGLDGVQ
jgi:hypothetical protein